MHTIYVIAKASCVTGRINLVQQPDCATSCPHTQWATMYLPAKFNSLSFLLTFLHFTMLFQSSHAGRFYALV